MEDEDYEDEEYEDEEEFDDEEGNIMDEINEPNPLPKEEVVKIIVDIMNVENKKIAEMKKQFDDNLDYLTTNPAEFLSRFDSYRIRDFFKSASLKSHLQINEEKIKSDISNIYDLFDINISHVSNAGVQFALRTVVEHIDPSKNEYIKFDFGRFLFSISYNIQNGTNNIVAYRICDNTPANGNDGSFHPHIRRDGAVCIGGYRDIIPTDIINIDIPSIIFNVAQVMQQYNKNSVWEDTIEAWLGAKCDVCKSYITPDDGTATCAKANFLIHDHCATIIDGQPYSANLVKKCTSCKKEAVDWVSKSGKIICGRCV